MDDFGNCLDKYWENWEQYIGSLLNPYGFFIGQYWPYVEGM